MPMAARYLALGGSRRRYYDLLRREVISRRQYRKRHGIVPASHSRRVRRLRASQGDARKPTHPTSDKPPQPFVKIFRLSLGKVAEIRPDSVDTYEVWIDQLCIAAIMMEQRDKRRRWHCGGCGYWDDNQYALAQHCYDQHYLDACQQAGVSAPVVLPVHEVHARERRARMPWRVQVPDFA